MHSSAAPTKRRACVRACVCGLIIDCMHRFDGSVRAKCAPVICNSKCAIYVWTIAFGCASRALPLCMWQPPNGSRVYDNVGRTMTVGHIGAYVQHTMQQWLFMCAIVLLHNAYANGLSTPMYIVLVLRLELHKSATRYIVQHIIALLFGFFKRIDMQSHSGRIAELKKMQK